MRKKKLRPMLQYCVQFVGAPVSHEACDCHLERNMSGISHLLGL